MSRCSYCYTEGHNRRTCPQLTKRLEESAAAGSSYSQSMLNARGKGSGRKMDTRRCSFCGTYGHDRRTCDKLNTFLKEITRRDVIARDIIRERMIDNGFGPGALVAFSVSDWDYENNKTKMTDYTGIISKIKWNDIGRTTFDARHQIALVKFFVQREGATVPAERWLSLPFDVFAKDLNEVPDRPSWADVPVTVSKVDVIIPDSYDDHRAILKHNKLLYKEQDSYTWEYREVMSELENQEQQK